MDAIEAPLIGDRYQNMGEMQVDQTGKAKN
jgi:hypothetical protein